MLLGNWKPIETAPRSVEVWTAIIDKNGIRNEQKMTFHSNLWWAGDLYVYYKSEIVAFIDVQMDLRRG